MENRSHRKLAGAAACALMALVTGGSDLQAQDCTDPCIPENPCSVPPCPGGYVDNGAGCCCSTHSPIVIDVDGQGFFLTNLADVSTLTSTTRGFLIASHGPNGSPQTLGWRWIETEMGKLTMRPNCSAT